MKKVLRLIWDCDEFWAIFNLVFGALMFYRYESGEGLFFGLVGIANIVCFFLMMIIIGHKRGLG